MVDRSGSFFPNSYFDICTCVRFRKSMYFACKTYLVNKDKTGKSHWTIKDICRKYHISKASLMRWMKKFDGTKESLLDASKKPKSIHPKAKSHINVGALERMFARIRKKYNLKNFSPHRLRHTLSTNLYANGGDLLFIMSIMGHTNMNTTKRYIHENKELNLKLYDKYKINIKKSP